LSFTIDPHAHAFYSLGSYTHSSAVFLPVIPVALVGPLVRLNELSVPFFLILSIFSNIFSAVGPSKNAISMHFILTPRALVHTPVGPDAGTHSFDLVLKEVTDVN
jgi:hypothetical protein